MFSRLPLLLGLTLSVRAFVQLSSFTTGRWSIGLRRSELRAEAPEIDQHEPKDLLMPLLSESEDSMDLVDEVKNSFMSYAMSTILSRCIPDVRDGLKPVHRRVLYAMKCLNLTPSSGYRKCARVVGEVLGKFHPHGDVSVYDALVRMAQEFLTLHPLVSGHGNFGSIDNDPAAAMRYTEAKLSKLAYDALLADIDDDTVTFVENFDGNEVEPLVLPARLPMLLINGVTGIAVGMATNIPPHNLNEVADAMIAVILNPDISDDDLFDIIPAPDFPTGGRLMGTEGVKDMYRTGHGQMILRSETHFEVVSSKQKGGGIRTKDAIIVTKLPYYTNKALLIEKIADLVNAKKLEGISDLRDESDRDGIRVVIELKSNGPPLTLVHNNLMKQTNLQSLFSGNMVALMDDGRVPQRSNLRAILTQFIAFRFKTIRRRTNFRLGKLESRDHIVDGLIIAIERMDDIFVILRGSKDPAAAKLLLKQEPFSLSDEQTDAILALRLTRLTKMEAAKLKEESAQLKIDIAMLKNLMNNDDEVYSLMISETKELKAAYGKPRQTIICGREEKLDDIDLVANTKSVIILTDSGYIKRLPFDEFAQRARGTKGKGSAKLSGSEDSVSDFFACNDHDSILFISEEGVAYSVEAFRLPLCSRFSKGIPMPQIFPSLKGEKIASMIPIDSFGENSTLVLLTNKGLMKKTVLKSFSKLSARGLRILHLRDGDKVSWTRCCQPDDELIVATKKGYISRFSTSTLISTGRNARGTRVLNLRPGDEMADFDVVPASLLRNQSSPCAILVTSNGYGKRVEINDFPMRCRNRRGITAIKPKKDANQQSYGLEEDAICCLRVCDPSDDIVCSTAQGQIVRQRVADIPIQGRRSTGIIIQRIYEGDSVVKLDVVPSISSDEEANENFSATLNADLLIDSVSA